MKKISHGTLKTFLGDGKISCGKIQSSKVNALAEKSFEKSNSYSQKNQVLQPRK